MKINPIQRWSIKDIEPNRRLDYHESALNTAVIPMGLTHADAPTFSFGMTYASFAGVGICKKSGPPHGAARRRSDIAQSMEHNFTLLMNLETSWAVDHRGPKEMSPFDVLVMDSEHPSNFEVQQSFTAINVSVSEPWLRRWLPDPSILAGAAYSRGNPLGARAVSLSWAIIAGFGRRTTLTLVGDRRPDWVSSRSNRQWAVRNDDRKHSGGSLLV